MRLIDADKVIEYINSIFLTKGEKRLLCRIINKIPTIARTDRPLAIINDKVIYMTDGHVNALLKYEHEQAVQEVCNQIMRDIIELQNWENDNGKK